MCDNKVEFVQKAVSLRNLMNGTHCTVTDIMKIYVGTPLADYITYDAPLGGYIPHKRKLRKKNYFV